MLFYRLHAAEGSYSTYMYVCRPGAEPGSTYLSSNQVRVVHLHVVGSTVVVVVALVP